MVRKSKKMGGPRKLERLTSRVQEGTKDVRASMCTCSFVWSCFWTLSLILIFYTFSISLTFYNQRFIHTYHFPISITLVHLFTKFILASVIRQIIECVTGRERVVLPWKDYFFKIAPPGIASSLDIGLSNWSFEFITISLYTMTKSTVIIYILGFSLLFKLEKPRCSLIAVVLLIASGLFMFTYQSTQFHMLGFSLVMSASFLSGLRWTLAQTVLQKSELGLSNPLDMMYHIQPWMILTLLPLSAAFEGVHLATTDHVFNYHEVSVLMTTIGITMCGAFLAFFLEFSEFLLVSHTSGLTLAIAGIFKEICTLYLAVEINGDKMSSLNAIGLCLCLAGITLHVVLKAVHVYREARQPKRLDDSVEMLLKNGSANADDDTDSEIDMFDARMDRLSRR